MIIKVFFSITFLLTITVAMSSCKKYLDVKSNQSLSTPGSITDLQLMLENPTFGKRGVSLAQSSSDDYFMNFLDWQSLRAEQQKLGYIWSAELNSLTDWQTQYENIYITNTVLDNLTKIAGEAPPTEQSNEVKGQALFLRAQCFYQLLQLYALQYDENTASTDLGIVLRLDSDFNKPSKRSTVQECYQKILQDMEEASTILPTTSQFNTRPNKASAFALLARFYLQIRNFNKAREFADKCLQLYSDLIDYNNSAEVDTTKSEPFLKRGINNKEIIYYLNDEGSIPAVYPHSIDSLLYKSYNANDIRKAAFFAKNNDGTYKFKGSYNGSLSTGAFVGLSTPEVYLIRAECNARLGNLSSALQDINALLITRFKTGTFVPETAATPDEALTIILQERRKEMVCRGMRWADLKRLNKEHERAITLIRILNGKTYELPPNDLRNALLIPEEVIQVSKIIQNQR